MFFLTKLYKWFHINNNNPSFSLIFYTTNDTSIDIDSNILNNAPQHCLRLINNSNNIYYFKKYFHDLRLTETTGEWCNPYIIELIINNLDKTFFPSLTKSYFFYMLRLLSTDINFSKENIINPNNEILIPLFGESIKSKRYYNEGSEDVENNFLYSITQHLITREQLEKIKQLNKYSNKCNYLNLNIFRFRFKNDIISKEYFAIEIKTDCDYDKINFILIDFDFYKIFKNEIEIDYYKIHKKYKTNKKVVEMYDEYIYKYKQYSDDKIEKMLPSTEEFKNILDHNKVRNLVTFYKNPNIFTYDYEKIKKLNEKIKHELILELYKPWRIENFLKNNNNVDMYLNC
jgi:hypothetical protein